MASYRTSIRKKVVAILKNAGPQTDAGQRVYGARILPVSGREEIPCLLVYTSDEKNDPTQDGEYLTRTCTLSIEGAVMGDEIDVEDLADQLADQVESVINSDPRLSGLLMHNLVLKSTATESGIQGEQVIAGFRMDYDAHYMTALKANDYPQGAMPTKVWTIPSATPEEYADILGINTPPIPNDENACGPDGCDLPAWQGELET